MAPSVSASRFLTVDAMRAIAEGCAIVRCKGLAKAENIKNKVAIAASQINSAQHVFLLQITMNPSDSLNTKF